LDLPLDKMPDKMPIRIRYQALCAPKMIAINLYAKK